jgi:hypothetical protein
MPGRRPGPGGIDAARMTFQMVNPHWTFEITRGIRQLVSYARLDGGPGNAEISANALAALVEVNQRYVGAKGRTFIANNPFVPDINATDGVVNETLEQLRQLSRRAVMDGNEPLMDHTHACLASLAEVYADIDYGTLIQNKTHTTLAAAYLADSVKALLRHDYPDVLMEAVHQLGRIGARLIRDHALTELTSITDTLAQVGVAGAAKVNYQPVTQKVMVQLANFSLALLQQQKGDIDFAIEKVTHAVVGITRVFLQVSDPNPMSSVHSTYLAPYYSAISQQSLPSMFEKLCAALAQAPAESEQARNILDNLDEWSEELYRHQRELLQMAVTARSSLTFDIIRWMETVAKGLLHAASSPACSDYTCGQLVRNAAWLATGITWVPNDAEAVHFAQNYGVTEALTRLAYDFAGSPHAQDELTGAAENLINWGLKASQHRTGRETLPACLAGIALAMTNAGGRVLALDLRQAVVRRVTEHLKTHELDLAQVVQSTRKRFVENKPERYSTDLLDIARRRIDDATFTQTLSDLLDALPCTGVRVRG